MDVSSNASVNRTVQQAEQSSAAQTPPKSEIESGDSQASRRVFSKPDAADQTEEIRQAASEKRVPPVAEGNQTAEARSIRISDELSRAITEEAMRQSTSKSASKSPETSDSRPPQSASSEKIEQEENVEKEIAEREAQRQANETRDGTERPEVVNF